MAAATKGNATYVVQVYSAFSPPHLTPLLVRINESATVAETIHAALSRLLAQDPTAMLPSDHIHEYTLRCAGGEGRPAQQSLPFDHSTVLRGATGLEFPFMVYMGYAAADANSSTANNTNADDANSTSAGGNAGGGVLGGSPGRRHVPLSAIEKAAYEAHRREIEARRAENIALIERRRFDQEVAAYHRSETHELRRRDEAERKAAEALKAEHDNALAAKEDLLSRTRDEESRRAQLAAVKKGNAKLVEDMRAEMHSAIAGDAKRREELAEALAIRRREEQHAADMANEKKRLFLASQRTQRIEDDFAALMGALDSSIAHDAASNEEHVSADRHRRQLFNRADADSQAIALIEQQRNYLKLNSRQGRRERDEADQQRFALLREQREAAEKEEEVRRTAVAVEWRDRQEAQREHLTSQIESEMLRERLGDEESIAAGAGN